MKKRYNNLVIFSLVLLISGCSKFTEITPKGTNIISRVGDLDLLLNFNFSADGTVTPTSLAATTTAQDAFNPVSVSVLVNDIYPRLTNVPNLIASKEQSLNYALTTYDEKVDRKVLAVSDIKYEKLYFIINNISNVIIKNADIAQGDRTKANQYKAEAYVLRAYMHFLLVNFYAKAYNPLTAATDGGIPYVKEDNLITVPNVKSTVAEVYANILSDLDAAFKLNSLVNNPVNNMRVGLAFAHAVHAEVLLSMRDFPGALAAANESLKIKNTVFDERQYKPVGTLSFGKPALVAPENLFFASNNAVPLFSALSMELTNQYFEKGSVVDAYVKPYYATPDPFSGLTGGKLWYFIESAYVINTGGLTTSDTYLIKAECLIRAHDVTGGMDIINSIRKLRIHPDFYAPLVAGTEAQAMNYLMRFSKVEKLLTFYNFINIKRWNADPLYKQTISKTIEGKTYSLKPESPLWIFPFPQSGTAYNNNLTQNY